MNLQLESLFFIESQRYSKLPFTPEEMNSLFRARVIEWIGSGYEFRMVGVASLGRRLLYVFPKYVHHLDTDEALGQRYVKILKRYMLSGAKRTPLSSKTEDIPLLVQTFEELNTYYVKYGLFKERRNLDVFSHHKKTNWSKTISKNEVIFSALPNLSGSQSSVLYYRPISSTVGNYEGQVASLFKIVLSLLASVLSPILRVNHPLENRLPISRLIEEMDKISQRANYYKRILQTHISAESGARKRILKILYKFLASDSQGIARIFGDKLFVFGTLNFELVWEDACLVALGALRSHSSMAQPKFLPRPQSNIEIQISNQKADGFIANDDNLTIIDAKYYVVSERSQSLKMSSTDIMKQYGYEVSCRTEFGRESIRNIFVLPCAASDTSNRFLGTISLQGADKTLSDVNDIEVFQLNPQEVFDSYVQQRPAGHLVDVINHRQDDPDNEHPLETEVAAPQATNSEATASEDDEIDAKCGILKVHMVKVDGTISRYKIHENSRILTGNNSVISRRLKRYGGSKSTLDDFISLHQENIKDYAHSLHSIVHSIHFHKSVEARITEPHVFARTCLDADNACSDTVWRNKNGAILRTDKARYTVPTWADDDASSMEATLALLLQLGSMVGTEKPSVDDSLARRWMAKFARGHNDFTEDQFEPSIFHAAQSKTSICALRITQDNEEDSRFKMLIPEQFVKSCSERQGFVALFGSLDSPYFLIDMEPILERVDTFKFLPSGKSGRYKVLIRGLLDGNPGLFSKAADKASFLALADVLHPTPSSKHQATN